MLQGPALRAVDRAGVPTDEPPLTGVQEALLFVRRRLWTILIPSLVGVVLAALLAYSLTPRYRAYAQLMIEPSASDPLAGDRQGGGTMDSVLLDGQAYVLKSAELLETVAADLDLASRPEFGAAPAPTEEPAGLFAPIRNLFAGTEAQTTELVPATPDVVVGTLRGLIEVWREDRSNVMSVMVEAEEPQLAADIANRLIDAYIATSAQEQDAEARRAADWLSERQLELQVKVQEAEAAVTSFKAENNLLDGEGSFDAQRLFQLEAQLADARAALAERRSEYQRSTEILESGGDVQAIPGVMDSSTIQDLRDQLVIAEQRLQELSDRYGEDSEVASRVVAARDDLRARIAEEAGSIVRLIENDVQVKEARVNSLVDEIAEVQRVSLSADTTVSRLQELERTAAASRALYEDFLARAGIADSAATFQQTGVRVVSPAVPSSQETFPPRKMIVVLGLLLGAAAGVAWGLTRESLQPGFVTSKQMSTELSVPVLASLPMSHRPQRLWGRTIDPLDVLISDPTSPYAEGVRTLRHSLLPSLGTQAQGVVQVTSAVPGEGKTTLSISIAASAAAAGYRVLLIDADLRRRGLTRRLGMMGSAGLTDLLTESPEQDRSISMDERMGFFVLPRGGASVSASDILASPRLQRLLEWARQSFDVVVVDSPPVANMADAIVLSKLVDGVLFSVRWGSTPREVVRLALSKLPWAKLRGVVSNQVDDRAVWSYGDVYSRYYQKDDFVIDQKDDA